MNRKSIIPILSAVLIVMVGVAAYVWNTANNTEGDSTRITTASENKMPNEGSPAATENPTLILPLRETGGSGQRGSVTFRQVEEGIGADIKILGQTQDSSEPAYIHSGTCANLGGIRYALTPVENGMSQTVLDTDPSTLINQMPLSLAIHRSLSEIGIVVACADSSL